MAFFSKNKKNKENSNEEKQLTALRRPSESLGRVLNESVPSAVIEIIRLNDKFFISRDEEKQCNKYIVMTLDVNTIGGLNKQAVKGNADKGQLIEYINCGNIESYVSSEGIEADKFVIIPTEKSIDSISEFDFIANKDKFELFIPTICTAYDKGIMEFEELDVRKPFAWFKDISKGFIQINNAVAELGCSELINGEVLENTQENTQENIQENIQEKNTETDMTENSITDSENSADDEVFLFGEDDKDEFEEALKSDEKSYIDQVTEQFEDDEFDNEYMEDDSDISEFSDDIDIELENEAYCVSCGRIVHVNDDGTCENCGTLLTDDVLTDDNSQNAEYEKKVEIQKYDITDAHVKDTVEHFLHAGDLDIEISSQPFDTRIIGLNPYLPLIDERADGWLDSYVTQLIKNSNEELRLMHNNNIIIARQRYLALINEQAEKIAKEVDYKNSLTPFSAMYENIEKQKESNLEKMDEQVNSKRSIIEQEWQEKIEAVKENAARRAEQNFRDEHTRGHEDRLNRVEIEIRDEIDKTYNESMKQMNQFRKDEAHKRLGISINETLAVITEDYKELLEGEHKKREELLANISNYIDSHLKDEVARNAVLAEGQRQKEEADKVRQEFNRKIEELNNNHKLTCDKYTDVIKNANVREEDLKRDYDKKLADEADRFKELENKYKELMDKYVSIDAEKSKEYENRIITLENDKKAVEEHLSHVDIVHNKFNKVSVVVWISIAVAMFAVGALVGNTLDSGKTNGGGSYSIQLTSPSNTESMEPSNTESTDAE